jgi:hypothetical protein
MSNFNYQKAYCCIALPAFENLSLNARNIHLKLIPLIGELQQNRQLNIPMTRAIEELLSSLSIKEIAELSRASYFVGHWQPGFLEKPFKNKRGESWKIANCCDQILRKLLSPLPGNIQIHEGKFRVTFSNRDCWLWEEFSLATEENLAIYKSCNLPFGESTLHKSANDLKERINDLWPNVDTIPDNNLYKEFLSLEKERECKTIIGDFNRKIKSLEQKKIDAQKEIDFLLLCNTHDINIDNIIYYSHKDTFCFGWRNPLSTVEKDKISTILDSIEHDYNIEYKLNS